MSRRESIGMGLAICETSESWKSPVSYYRCKQPFERIRASSRGFPPSHKLAVIPDLDDFSIDLGGACVLESPPMREMLFILALIMAVIYWMMNPDQVDSAVNWVMRLFNR